MAELKVKHQPIDVHPRLSRNPCVRVGSLLVFCRVFEKSHNAGNLNGSGNQEKLAYQIIEDIDPIYLTQQQFALNRNQQKLSRTGM